jgi:tRNA pseudouridine38-40 synthase
VRLGYDGDGFYGVTLQPDRPTVAAALHARVLAAAGTRARALHFAARTDKGVHAEDNLATFWLPRSVEVSGVLARMCAQRPDGLRHLRADWVAPSVFARGISTGKRYRYRLQTGVTAAPWRGDRWRIAPRFDPERAQVAAAALVGTHDFRSFCVRHPPTAPSQRTLTRLTVTPAGPERWDLVVEGDGFLRRMVRILAGTLIEVGVGLRPASSMPDLIAARDREAAGILAPAHGLTLERVFTGPIECPPGPH